jgi:hypothetical protein
METKLSKEEREAILIEREERLERNYKRGKLIVAVISITWILLTIITMFINFSVLVLIINLIAAGALWFGVKWVRFYYAGSVVFWCFAYFSILFRSELLSQVPVWGLVLIMIQLNFGIISAILLFKDKGVIDFMDYQKESPY